MENISEVSLLLASKSPRRREILQQMGVKFEVVAVDVPEICQPGESPADYVKRLALEKAQAGYALHAGSVVLGADTLGVCDGLLLEKPESQEHALEMLMTMSGRTHEILSSVALCSDQGCAVGLSVTEVRFKSLNESLIRRYWASGEPCDKAGAYGIQGLGALLVEHISGSYSGVVGLPIEITSALLEQYHIATGLSC